jgi:hypothetical protein
MYKARDVAIIFTLAITALYPSKEAASFVMLFFIPAVLLATFGPTSHGKS